MNKLFLLLALLLPMVAISGESFDGRVASVVDGDTLMVDVPGRGQLRVRLAWVDAPDRLQEHGEAAKASLSEMAVGRELRLENAQALNGRWVACAWVVATDAPCRNMGGCPKTLDLGLAQLTRGMAWHDRRSPGQAPQSRGQYEQAEFEAKIHRNGLWRGKNPVPPWDWRGR